MTVDRYAHVREWARKAGWTESAPSSETLCITAENGDVLVEVSFFLGSDEAQFEFMGKTPHVVVLAIPCDGRNEEFLALLEKFRRVVPAELPEFLVALIDGFPDAYDIGSGDAVPLDRDYVRAISEWAR